TRLPGTKGVDLRAVQNNVAPVQDRTAVAIGFIGIGIDGGGTTNNLHTKVDGDPGVTVFAGPRPLGGQTVAANDPEATTLVTRPGFERLALFVEAAHNGTKDENDKTRNINWDSDVVISAGPSPELVVRPDGQVIRPNNTTVNRTNNPAPGTQRTGLNGHQDINVADVYNHGDSGQVVMEAKADDSGDGTITQSFTNFVSYPGGVNFPNGVVHPDVVKSKYWGTFFFNDNFDSVRITNESAANLVINNI